MTEVGVADPRREGILLLGELLEKDHEITMLIGRRRPSDHTIMPAQGHSQSEAVARSAVGWRATLLAVQARSTTDPVALEFAERVRARLGHRLRQVVLFGSRARGEARQDSDYDVVVVVDRRGPDVREALLEIEVDLMDRYGSLVACLLRDEQEWAASQRLPLGLNVAREGVPL